MSTGTAEQVPDLAQKQEKTIERTARSFFKGGMGLVLKNFQSTLNLGQRNANRFMSSVESRDAKGQPKAGGITEPTKSEDDMRIDSDDIHYHLMPSESAPAPSAGGTLAKLAGTALLATGIGAPLGIGLMMAPEIIRAWNGSQTPAVAPVTPTESKAGTVTIGGHEYELGLEP